MLRISLQYQRLRLSGVWEIFSRPRPFITRLYTLPGPGSSRFHQYCQLEGLCFTRELRSPEQDVRGHQVCRKPNIYQGGRDEA